jgi:hypothetical protein
MANTRLQVSPMCLLSHGRYKFSEDHNLYAIAHANVSMDFAADLGSLLKSAEPFAEEIQPVRSDAVLHHMNGWQQPKGRLDPK